MVISFSGETEIYPVEEAFPLKRLLYDAVFFREKPTLFTQNSKQISKLRPKIPFFSLKRKGKLIETTKIDFNGEDDFNS
jgi:hypothetical protein